MYLRFLLMFSCLTISALSTINLKTFTFCLDRVYLCTESLWGWEFSCLLRRLFGCVPSTAPQVTYGVDSSVAELSNNSQYLHMYPFWRWEKYTHWNDDWYLDSRNKRPSWVWLFDFVFGGEQLPSALLRTQNFQTNGHFCYVVPKFQGHYAQQNVPDLAGTQVRHHRKQNDPIQKVRTRVTFCVVVDWQDVPADLQSVKK